MINCVKTFTSKIFCKVSALSFKALLILVTLNAIGKVDTLYNITCYCCLLQFYVCHWAFPKDIFNTKCPHLMAKTATTNYDFFFLLAVVQSMWNMFKRKNCEENFFSEEQIMYKQACGYVCMFILIIKQNRLIIFHNS